MSKNYKGICKKITQLHQDLIYQLGLSYLNNRPYEPILRSFVKNLDFIIYPNTVFTENGIPIKEHKYDEFGNRLLDNIEVLNEEII